MARRDDKMSIEDIVQFPARLTRIMEGLEDEIEYLIEHNFFEEFEQLGTNMERLMMQMESLTASIDKFTEAVDTITENTATMPASSAAG